MDKQHIPMKYILGVWKDLEGYPSKEDVLYEIASYVEKRQQKNFTKQTLDALWKDDARRPSKEQLLQDLITEGRVSVDRDRYQVVKLFGEQSL